MSRGFRVSFQLLPAFGAEAGMLGGPRGGGGFSTIGEEDMMTCTARKQVRRRSKEVPVG